MINVAFIENDLPLLESYKNVIKDSTSTNCLLTANTVEKFLKFKKFFSELDIVFLNVHLTGISGIDALPKLKKQLGDIEVIILSEENDFCFIYKAICAGATGYLLKPLPPEDLVAKIEDIMANGNPLSPEIARRIIKYYNPPIEEDDKQLTPQEQQVAKLLAEGFSYKETAAFLNVSINTIRMYVKRIYKKLSISSKTDLANFYFKKRW